MGGGELGEVFSGSWISHEVEFGRQAFGGYRGLTAAPRGPLLLPEALPDVLLVVVRGGGGGGRSPTSEPSSSLVWPEFAQ